MSSSRTGVAAWFSTAQSHHRAARLQEAEALYRRVLEHDPRHAEATHYLGLLATETGRHAEGIDLLKRAAMISPLVSHFHSNLAEALRRMGNLDEALVCSDRAIQIDSKSSQAHYVRAVTLLDAGQEREAAIGFLRAIQLDPRDWRAYNNLGNALSKIGRFTESLEAYSRAAALAPHSHEILSNWSLTLLETGKPKEALEKARRAVELSPDDPTALCNLARCAGNWFDLDDAISKFRRALAVKPRYPLAHSDLLFVMLHHQAVDDQELLEAHAEWGARHAPPPPQRSHVRDRSARRPLRIGYVSPDFREHPVSYFVEPVLANHTQEVQVFLYSNASLPEQDPTTARIKAYGHAWRDIRGVSDAKLAQLIDQQDQIDILVDLTGHTANHRLQLFGLKPAPIQASYLGYQATTGVASIDYRLTDALADPPGQTDRYHTEKLERMEVFACYRPPPAPDVAPLPMLRNGHITFGCYTKIEKISDQSLDLWSQVLKRVPDSKLIVFASVFDEPEIAGLLQERLGSRGIDRSRVSTVGRQPLGPYFQSHERVDMILDTLPFNGHTTTCHALWMGVPTLTISGSRYASRMGLAVMTHLKLEEFVTHSAGQFVDRAAEMSGDADRLNDLRKTLRERMRTSPLMDEKRFTSNLEEIYRKFWHCWLDATAEDRGQGAQFPAATATE